MRKAALLIELIAASGWLRLVVLQPGARLVFRESVLEPVDAPPPTHQGLALLDSE